MGALLALTSLLTLFADTKAFVPDTLVLEDSTIGVFDRATRFTVSPQGWIYVVDERRNLIRLFKDQPAKSLEIGGFGWQTSAFDKPSGIATDGLNVFVADYGNHRVQRFDRNLNYLSSLATRDTSVPNARFGYPLGVSLSTSGDLFVLDGENLRIVRFARDGRFLQSFGGIEAERGRLRQPLKITVSPEDRIFVGEPDRVVEFDFFGNFVRSVGERQVTGLRSCAANKDAIVAVSPDTLYWFSSTGELSFKKAFRQIPAREPLNDVQDVFLQENHVSLLDARRLVRFSLEVR
jgi:hypothetical protein